MQGEHQRVTDQQIRDLETFSDAQSQGASLKQLLTEFKAQRQALAALRQYVQMFSDAEGTAADVEDLVSDLKEILDGVETTGST